MLFDLLGGLGLASPCWSCWGSTEVEGQGTHQGHVALISQWSDDKPLGVTKVLVAVWEARLHALDVAVILLPVVPEL